MPMPITMMMKSYNQPISWDAFNWSSPWYPIWIEEPFFTQSKIWYISVEWKTKLIFWPNSYLDDILIMVKDTDIVTESIDSWVYTYTMPISWILFYPTAWSTEMSSPYLTKYLTDWVHTVWNVTASWASFINAWFNVKSFSSWISISELEPLWFITGNLCRFRFYYIIWWWWMFNIDTFN